MQRHSKPLIYAYHFDILGKTSIPRFQIDVKYIEYRKKWEEHPQNFIVSDFPLHLDIEVSARCNLMCQHCIRHSRRTVIGDMKIELFRYIIDQGSKYGLYSIDPDWMGESFLHPQLMEMIRYAKSKGVIDTRISTNGTLIDRDMCQRVLDSGLDKIIFSLDAVTGETYKRLKVGSDFALVNNNIETLIEEREKKCASKPNITVQMIDQQHTHEEIMAFIHYWRTRVDNVRIAIYQSPDGKPRDKRRTHNKPETIFPCPSIWQRLVVAWDGTVYTCGGDNACRNPLGNVKNQNIHDIWHGEYMSMLREKHKNYEADDIEICSHCDLNKIPKEANGYQNGLRHHKKQE